MMINVIQVFLETAKKQLFEAERLPKWWRGATIQT